MTGDRPLPKPRIRVELAGPTGVGTRVLLDGVELPGVSYVSVGIGVSDVHRVTVVFISPEVEVVHIEKAST